MRTTLIKNNDRVKVKGDDMTMHNLRIGAFGTVGPIDGMMCLVVEEGTGQVDWVHAQDLELMKGKPSQRLRPGSWAIFKCADPNIYTFHPSDGDKVQIAKEKIIGSHMVTWPNGPKGPVRLDAKHLYGPVSPPRKFKPGDEVIVTGHSKWDKGGGGNTHTYRKDMAYGIVNRRDKDKAYYLGGVLHPAYVLTPENGGDIVVPECDLMYKPAYFGGTSVKEVEEVEFPWVSLEHEEGVVLENPIRVFASKSKTMFSEALTHIDAEGIIQRALSERMRIPEQLSTEQLLAISPLPRWIDGKSVSLIKGELDMGKEAPSVIEVTRLYVDDKHKVYEKKELVVATSNRSAEMKSGLLNLPEGWDPDDVTITTRQRDAHIPDKAGGKGALASSKPAPTHKATGADDHLDEEDDEV